MKILISLLIIFSFISCQKKENLNQKNKKLKIIQNRIDKYKLWGDLIFEDNNLENSKFRKSDELIFLLKNFNFYRENNDYTRINYFLLYFWKDSVAKLTYILGDLEAEWPPQLRFCELVGRKRRLPLQKIEF